MTSHRESSRFIVCHYHRISARLRFLLIGEHACPAFPDLSAVLDESPQLKGPAEHPGLLLQRLRTELEALPDQLRLVSGFRRHVEMPREISSVYLAEVTGPHPLPAPPHGRWVELVQARNLPPVELALLRAVYEWFLY